MRGEYLQKLDFASRQFLDGLAAFQLKALRVYAGRTDLERLCIGFLWPCAAFSAAQQSMDTGEQFAHTERFSDVIIRAGIQPYDLVNFLVFGGGHENWDLDAL